MNHPVSADEWRPVGIDDLEPAALEALRATSNVSVIAGPGAGKTELLAQRACYLLQTGICAYPRSILAISYKRDSARNLQRRVELRCGPVLARRFRSLTLDAFAKGLVDRFLPALPDAWRPGRDYQIDASADGDARDFLLAFANQPKLRNAARLAEIEPKEFLRDYFYGAPIELEPGPISDVVWWAARKLWSHRLHEMRPARLTFPMLGRLAEAVLRASPKILVAMRATYAYVFLDEFQDTTHVQYDLVKTGFLGSDAILTAVGDNKQRIMGFAMAMRNAFGPFEADYAAKRYRLTRNYRSVTELVRVQRVLANAIDPHAAQPEAAGQNAKEQGRCVVWTFPNTDVEARYLTSYIKYLVTKEVVKPRDIAVLVKLRAEVYSEGLVRRLAEKGIQARVEAELQDLLAEPLTETILDFLKFALRARSAAEWSRLVELMAATRTGEESERHLCLIEHELSVYRRNCRESLSVVDSRESLERVIREMLGFVGEPYRLIYPQYKQGDQLERVLAGCVGHLWKCFESARNWEEAMRQFEGADCVPIMTIHKSKGLEYDTVIFVGLEDSAFWSFREQSDEDRSAFFVAYSRAKRNVVFTFSSQRKANPRRGVEAQGREEIGELYALLRSAGVRERHIEEWPQTKARK